MEWKDELKKGWNGFLDAMRLDDDDDDDGGLEAKVEVIYFKPVEQPSFLNRILERMLRLKKVKVVNKK